MMYRESRGRAGYRLAREWLVGLVAYAILIAPVGCEFQNLLLNGSIDPSQLTSESTGLFVNGGTDGSVLAAGRNAAGDQFFIYGNPSANAGVGSIDSIRVIQADGSESSVVFEYGWPVYARGPAGSYVLLEYQQQGDGLSVTVTVHDAATGTDSTHEVVVDLSQTAEQVAAAVQALTGRTVEVPTAPSGLTSKQDQRSLGTFLTGVLIATTLATTLVILGQVFVGLHTVVDALVRATLILVFWPVFLIGALFNQLGGAVIEIEFLSLTEIFGTLPDPPVVVIS
ncbi:MAG: hypothetical protein ABIG44_06680 [Planctomycetota bacterium]